uniref:Myotubularin related protein 14 n=1 Tax=Sparus aurata TaxID=8175 RepID=A0A671TL62_SPAAU
SVDFLILNFHTTSKTSLSQTPPRNIKLLLLILFCVSFQVEEIEKHCLELFARDYKYSIIHNANGEVCGHYPRQIVFLEYECTDVERDRFESTVQITKLQDLVNRSKLARCRGRFVCPVILYNGKHICRSSTLAGWGELYGRTGYNYIFSGGADDTWTESEEVLEDDSAVRNGDSQLFDKVRGHDIKLLRYLSVRYICDLMVENKKVKFGLNVTSSEKADKAQRYADFTLLSVPYPGCEFFKDYKDRDYTAEGLVFNWNQDYVDAPLTIPVCFTQNLNIDWTQYQILNRHSGLLVHCISGWDRTPLFVSLLRLSLWADGAVHASLEPSQILYLTIAYDWFLFGRKGTTSSPQMVVWNKQNPLEEHLSHPLNEARSSSSSSSNQSEHSVTRTGSSPLAVPGRRLAADYTRSGSSLSTEYGSWQIVSGCGSIHDHAHFPLPLASVNTSSAVAPAYDSPLPFSFQDEGPSGRMCPLLSERQARLEAVREVFLAAYSSTVGLKSSAPSPSGAISGLLEQFARGVGLRGTNAIV